MSYPPTSPTTAPPPPPPKTREDLPQAAHIFPTSAPPRQYQQLYPLHSTPPPSHPQRPPSHPTLTYAEQQDQSPPQFYDPASVPANQSTPAELGGGDEHAAYLAGRAQGSLDRGATAQLPSSSPQQQPPPPPQPPEQRAQPQQPAFPPDGWVPDILKTKPKQDLEHLVNTPALLAALLQHPAHQPAILTQSNEVLRQHLASTSALADKAGQMAKQVSAQREQTQAHLLRARGAEQSWRRKQKEMEDALEQFGPRELHRRLAGKVREGEEGLGAVVESWLSAEGVAGEREAAEWVRSVREGRRVVELRRERRARWDEGRVGGWR